MHIDECIEDFRTFATSGTMQRLPRREYLLAMTAVLQDGLLSASLRGTKQSITVN
jgi:hypothetical protein